MFVCVAILGYKRFELQNIVEDHLKLLIVRNFDPKKADLIFTEEGSVGARKPNTSAHYTQACVSRGSLHIAHMHTHLYTQSMHT